MGELFCRHITVEGAKRLAQRRNGKGKIAAYLKRYLPEAKRIIESEYGIRIRKNPKIFVSMPLVIYKNGRQMFRDRIRLMAKPGLIFSGLKSSATYHSGLKAISISPFRHFMRRLKFANKKEFNVLMKRTLLHELTHHAIFEKNLEICPVRNMASKIVQEGLCEYSKEFLPLDKGKPMTIFERIRREVHDFANGIIFWQNNLKELFLEMLSEERRELLIARNPEKWVSFDMKYALGREFVSELAKKFNDNKKLFRFIADMRMPRMEDVLHPKRYAESVFRIRGQG